MWTKLALQWFILIHVAQRNLAIGMNKTLQTNLEIDMNKIQQINFKNHANKKNNKQVS
jgi:hypothetical protein